MTSEKMEGQAHGPNDDLHEDKDAGEAPGGNLFRGGDEHVQVLPLGLASLDLSAVRIPSCHRAVKVWIAEVGGEPASRRAAVAVVC